MKAPKLQAKVSSRGVEMVWAAWLNADQSQALVSSKCFWLLSHLSSSKFCRFERKLRFLVPQVESRGFLCSKRGWGKLYNRQFCVLVLYGAVVLIYVKSQGFPFFFILRSDHTELGLVWNSLSSPSWPWSPCPLAFSSFMLGHEPLCPVKNNHGVIL